MNMMHSTYKGKGAHISKILYTFRKIKGVPKNYEQDIENRITVLWKNIDFHKTMKIQKKEDLSVVFIVTFL